MKVARADVGAGCSWNNRPAHSPCGASDNVFATVVTPSPPTFTKPSVDFAYWYENAAPGPKHPCTTTSGSPPVFDDNGVYDRSLTVQDLAPSSASYVCQVRDARGNLTGELSWDAAAHVLKVTGTIFVDGDVTMHVQGQTVNYQGRAALYTSGTYENFGEVVCAGGNGNTNCHNSDMANWDPTQNLLVLLAGGKTAPGTDVTMHHTASAFQGAVYAVHDCEVSDTSYSSGPLICEKVLVDKTASLYPWTPLPSLLTAQVYGSPWTSSAWQLVLGPQDE
jgi:hypothetical protein